MGTLRFFGIREMASTWVRTVSGLPAELPTLKNSALVLIDIQNTYREGIMKLTNVEPAVKEAATLLERARKAKTPVFHVRHEAGPGTPYDTSERIGQICDEVAPQGDEVVITKNYPNSFLKTDLE